MSWQGTDHSVSLPKALPKALLEPWDLGKALQGSGHPCAISLGLAQPQVSSVLHCLCFWLCFSTVRKQWTVRS